MVRAKGRGRGGSAGTKAKNQRETNGLSTAFRDMLAEVQVDSSPSQTGDEARPLKRRRVRGQLITQEEVGSGSLTTSPKSGSKEHPSPQKHQYPVTSNDEAEPFSYGYANNQSHQVQTAFKDETSEESDFAWEEVDMAQETDQPVLDQANGEKEGDLNLVLNDHDKQDRHRAAAARRKPLSAAEKQIRLNVHKMHLLCLLSHIHLRNHWCNDQNVHVRSQSIKHGFLRIRTKWTFRKPYTVDYPRKSSLSSIPTKTSPYSVKTNHFEKVLKKQATFSEMPSPSPHEV